MKRVGLIFVLLLLALQGWAQSPLYYFNSIDDFFGNGYPDIGIDAFPFSDSSYVIFGNSKDSVHGGGLPNYWFSRPNYLVVSKAGDILFRKDFERPFEQLLQGFNDEVVATPDGGFAVSGTWQRWDSGFVNAYYGKFLLKLNSNLDSIWMALDSGSNVLNQVVIQRKLLCTSDHGYIMYGANSFRRVVLTKFDSLGDKSWDRVLPNPNTAIWNMESLDNGNYLLSGQAGNDCYLFEGDLFGNTVWDTTFNNVNPNFQNGSFAVQLQNGGYFVYDFLPDSNGCSDIHCMWWDASKNLLFERIIYLPVNQYASGVLELADGSVILSGPTGTINEPYINNRGFVLKLSPDGHLIWLRTYYYWHAGDNVLQDCASTNDGGFILTGSTWDTTGTSPYEDTWILKVDSVGCPYPNCGPSLAVQPTETVQPNLIQAFPNPASMRLNLKCKESGLHEKSVLRLLALDGKVMDEVIMPMGFQEIGFDVSRFPAGTYFWEYRDEIGRHESGRFEVMR